MRCSPAISRRVRRTALTLLADAVLATAPMNAPAVCTLKAVELPVTMRGLRPMVHARINGTDALFLADSGAFYLAPRVHHG
jgi:hypothetical protein